MARIDRLKRAMGTAVKRDRPSQAAEVLVGIHHGLQNYVVLTLPSIFAAADLEIYELRRDSEFKDRTKDYVSRRDRRRDKRGGPPADILRSIKTLELLSWPRICLHPRRNAAFQAASGCQQDAGVT